MWIQRNVRKCGQFDIESDDINVHVYDSRKGSCQLIVVPKIMGIKSTLANLGKVPIISTLIC